MTGSATNRQADLLLKKSSEDEAALPTLSADSHFGFHAQQAIEKSLKALITQLGDSHEFTHDLLVLVKHLKRLGETLPVLPMNIIELTDYAGVFRYDEPPHISDRAVILESVRILREHVAQRIAALQH